MKTCFPKAAVVRLALPALLLFAAGVRAQGTGDESPADGAAPDGAPGKAPGGAVTNPAPADWQVEQKDLRIPMRDGKWLAADLFLPPRPGKYPAILIHTPYNKSRRGAALSREADPDGGGAAPPTPAREPAGSPPKGGGGSSGAGDPAPAPASGRRKQRAADGLFDREHYVYMIADWRGFYGSRAAAAGVARMERGKDGYDLVEWLAAQPWSNGKVGTWGPSALGKVQFDTAVEHPPHLVCAVPVVAAIGNGYEDYYAGGVYREAHCQTLDFLGYGVSAKVRAAPLPDQLVWRLIERRQSRPSDLAVPMLLITGWWDNSPDAILDTFARLKKEAAPACREHSRLLIGPWDHMSIDLEEQGDARYPDAAGAARAATTAFFDCWLRGEKNGWEKTPTVRYYQVGDGPDGRAGCWFQGERFPGAKIAPRTWYLHADGVVSQDAPKPAASGDPAAPGAPSGTLALERRYRHDPRQAVKTLGGANLPPLPHGPTDHRSLGKRADLLNYATAPLEAPLRMTGAARLVLTAAVNRVSADFAVWLLDETPDGRWLLVAEGVQRATIRDGRSRTLAPGEPFEVAVTMPVQAYTWAKGHRLRVLIGSANSPRYERNPHTGAHHWDEAAALDLDVRVFHDAPRVPRLELPCRGE